MNDMDLYRWLGERTFFAASPRTWNRLIRTSVMIFVINDKNSSLSIVLTVTHKKLQKIIKSDISHHYVA